MEKSGINLDSEYPLAAGDRLASEQNNSSGEVNRLPTCGRLAAFDANDRPPYGVYLLLLARPDSEALSLSMIGSTPEKSRSRTRITNLA
jgi:hypothetical protein